MKLTLEQERPEAPANPPENPTVLFFEAIVRLRCIEATYNRTRMVLAPHILYTRHGALHLDAIIVSRENMLPKEVKLGTFKVDGLSGLRLTERAFEPNRDFEPEAEKYVGETLMAVERAA
ncbi:MAG: hypothetical protein V4574_16295 [Pseudomonadota bacterium]